MSGVDMGDVEDTPPSRHRSGMPAYGWVILGALIVGAVVVPFTFGLVELINR